MHTKRWPMLRWLSLSFVIYLFCLSRFVAVTNKCKIILFFWSILDASKINKIVLTSYFEVGKRSFPSVHLKLQQYCHDTWYLHYTIEHFPFFTSPIVLLHYSSFLVLYIFLVCHSIMWKTLRQTTVFVYIICLLRIMLFSIHIFIPVLVQSHYCV